LNKMSDDKPRRVGPRWVVGAIGFVFFAIVVGHFLTPPAYGALLGNRSMKLSSNDIGATTDYLLSFDLSTAGPLGSISIQFCANDPLPNDSCTVPGGFSDSAAILADQTGPGGFSIDTADSGVNKLILTRPQTNVPVSAASYHFTGITNPSSPGSYYVRVQTYASTNATGPGSDYGGIAIAIVNGLAISAEVPPYLIFCTGVTISDLNCATATGDYIDFGELSTSHASSGSSQMLVATNAKSGYVISVDGTTLTSGTNSIAALAPGDVSRPGTAQFGFNLRANTTPKGGVDPTGPGAGQPDPLYNQPDTYRFAPADTLVSNIAPDDVRQFTASYIVNVPPTQAPGVYVSTLTYICLATF
jgi:hypothetical protein